MSWASVVAFVPQHNSHGKKDTSHAFRPEASRFLREADNAEGQLQLHTFDNRQPMEARRAEVLDKLSDYRDQDRKVVCVAFFCHGWATGLQAGFDLDTVGELAAGIAQVAGAGVIVPLYACSTADTKVKGAPGGDGGFADELRDALCREGLVNCRVDAHDRKGHTTTNPYVRRFEGRGSRVGGVGGAYLVSPEKRRQWVRWRHLLGTPAKPGIARLHFPWWETRLISERVEGS